MLAGCETFDPTDIFSSDMFSTKKKLPGDRKAVFPEGTPGVSRGVPQELVKGYQPPTEPEPAQAAPEEPKAKPKPKPRPVAKSAPPPAEQRAAAPPQQPPQQQPPRQQPAAGGWPGQQSQGGGVAWPDPPSASR
jgi:outer membrane biosynthesis protein TonB